ICWLSMKQSRRCCRIWAFNSARSGEVVRGRPIGRSLCVGRLFAGRHGRLAFRVFGGICTMSNGHPMHFNLIAAAHAVMLERGFQPDFPKGTEEQLAAIEAHPE